MLTGIVGGLSGGWFLIAHDYSGEGEPIITTTNDFTPLTPMMCSEPNHREAQKGRSGGIGASTKEVSPLFADRKSRK